MELNTQTAEKIQSLLKIGKHYNTCTYCGCWNAETVDFKLSCEIDNETIAGIVLTVTEDFKIVRVRRLKACREYIGSKFIGRWEYLPIVPKINFTWSITDKY